MGGERFVYKGGNLRKRNSGERGNLGRQGELIEEAWVKGNQPSIKNSIQKRRKENYIRGE